jgi:hypothetical protein
MHFLLKCWFPPRFIFQHPSSSSVSEEGLLLHLCSTMQDDFPKVDLSERGDLDHVLEQIRKHSLALLREELRKSGHSSDRKAQKTCEETIELVSDERDSTIHEY